MSSSSGTTVDSTANAAWSRCGSFSGKSGSRAQWSTMNIAGMVIGFVFFWPIGLGILAWIMTGHHVRDLPAAIRDVWSRFFSGAQSKFQADSDNIIFNEYQQTQYDRISEIKNEIHERARRFADFRQDIQRRRDREEFDRFMASAPGSSDR